MVFVFEIAVEVERVVAFLAGSFAGEGGAGAFDVAFL